VQSYAISVLGAGIPAIIIAVIPALLFWYLNLKSSLLNRVLIISPTIIIIVSFIIAAITSSYTTYENHKIAWSAYQGALLIAIISIAVSIKLHKGSKFNHFAHLLTIIAASYLWLIGGMALSHDWL